MLILLLFEWDRTNKQAQDEYYLYNLGSTELQRRKVGSWVNVSRFLPLIRGVPKAVLENKLKSYQPRHMIIPADKEALRLAGTWISLDNAREFAETHGISQKVAPILSFERIAMVSYSNTSFYETFIHMSIDVNIRVLREVSTGMINMDQVFSVYTKVRSDKAMSHKQRSRYPHHNITGDSAICGGRWTTIPDVIKYSIKHAFYSFIQGILGFKTNPDEGKPEPIDVFERCQRLFWIPTGSDAEFFGYPRSFQGGLAPRAPARNSNDIHKSFYDELVVEKNLTIELSRSRKPEYQNVALLRRLSDGWVNCTVLVQVCAMILDVSTDDPNLRTENELHFRDVLERYPYELVLGPNTKAINGKWCSSRDALSIFNSFKIDQTILGKQVHDLLTDPTFADLDCDPRDNSSDDNDDYNYNDNESDDFVLVEKDNLHSLKPPKKQKKKKDAVLNGKENGTIQIHDELDDVVLLNREDLTDDPGINKRIFVSSDSEGEGDEGESFGSDRKRKRPVVVDLEPEFIEVSTWDTLPDKKRRDSADSLFESPPPSWSNIEFLPVDELARKLRSICSSIDTLIQDPRKVRIARTEKMIKENLKKLQYFNAVDSDLKVKSKLNNTLHNLHALNLFNKELSRLVERWIFESSTSKPSLTPLGSEPRVWPPPVDFNARPAKPQQQRTQSEVRPQSPSRYPINTDMRPFPNQQQQRPPDLASPRHISPQVSQMNAVGQVPQQGFGYGNRQPLSQQQQQQQQQQWQQQNLSIRQREPNGPMLQHQYQQPQQQGYGHQGPFPNGNWPQHQNNNNYPPQNNFNRFQGVPQNVHNGNHGGQFQARAGHFQTHNGTNNINYNADRGGYGQGAWVRDSNRGSGDYGRPYSNKQYICDPNSFNSGPRGGSNNYKSVPRGPSGFNQGCSQPVRYNDNNNNMVDSPYSRGRSHWNGGYNDSLTHPVRARERNKAGGPPQKENGNRFTRAQSPNDPEIMPNAKPLSPVSNYCDLKDEVPDPYRFGQKDNELRQAIQRQRIDDECKEKSLFGGMFASSEYTKYKKATQFEIGTHKDLLWRRDVIFGDDAGVPMTKRILCMLQELKKKSIHG